MRRVEAEPNETLTQLMQDTTLDIQQHKNQERILSCDLGKQRDFTTLAPIEIMPQEHISHAGNTVMENHFYVRDIARLPLGTDYEEVAEIIYHAYHAKDLWMRRVGGKTVRPTLLVDVGGPGHPVCDTLEKRMGLMPIRIQLVRGQMHTTVKPRPNTRLATQWSVPRPRLFAMADAAWGSSRVHIDEKLPLAQALIDELRNLKREQDEQTAYVRVTHREGEHDDLAIAVAQGIWWGDETEKPRPAPRVRFFDYGAFDYGASGDLRRGRLGP